MRKIVFVSTLLLFLCVSSFGLAFDNHRQGFIIGGIGGIAVNHWREQEDPDIDEAYWTGTNVAIHTDFRIGGGFKGDKFMLYYWNTVNWFRLNQGNVNDLTINGITGIGASYYFKPSARSLYINAGIGASSWVRGITDINTADRSLGLGLMGGIGYEFARHWSVELGVMYGRASTSDGKPNFVAGTLSIIGIAY